MPTSRSALRSQSDPDAERSDELLALLRTMVRIREFEERVAKHFRAGNIHGFVHVSIGQESVAAAAGAALEAGDLITTTHRGHGHCLAKGAQPRPMMAELFGRSTGLCSGRGGSMHLADASIGILGANGIVGAGIPLAVGAALAIQVRQGNEVCVAFFGEGALHSGAFHEAVCLAVAWNLPVLFLCESNGWAEFTRSDAWLGPRPAERAGSYGLRSASVSGADVLALFDLVSDALGLVREGAGPSFLEVETVRQHGHYEGDAQPYRPKDESDAWANLDPIAVAKRRLQDRVPEVSEIEREAGEEMDAAVAAALSDPYPAASEVLDHVYG
jgi:TPP-dependent pyruvate/acetoin dehydrogenase alpha subunit